MHADLEAPQVIGATPMGTRQVFIVKGGTVEGPRIKGKLLPGGGDWALVRSDGAVQLDVRATIQTDDGALVYGTYGGSSSLSRPYSDACYGPRTCRWTSIISISTP